MVRRQTRDLIIIEIKHRRLRLADITAEQQAKLGHALMIMRDVVEDGDIRSVERD